MRRTVAAALGLAVLTGSALVAQASSLTVDAGVLQTLTMPAEIDVPDDPVEYIAVEVVIRRYNGPARDQSYRSTDPAVTYLVPSTKTYTVGFAGSVYDCPGDSQVDTTQPHGDGTFGPFAASPIIHTLCVQHSHYGLTLTINDDASGP